MFQWSRYPFLRITAAWIAGILVGNHFEGFPTILYWAMGLMYAATILLLKVKRLFYSLNWAIGAAILSVFFLGGALHAFLFNEKNDPLHFMYAKPFEFYYGKINDGFEETPKFRKTTVRVRMVMTSDGWTKARGTVQVYFPKNSAFRYGDFVLIKGPPNNVSPPANPGEFDYRQYLSRQNIFHTHFIRSGSGAYFVRHGGDSFKSWILGLREAASSRIRQYVASPRERSVALALILGLRNELDNNLMKAYGGSGAIHVLAVSGLHVGVVYAFILAALGWLRRSLKGKFLFAFVNLFILWLYCFLTGLSPSAMRATIMFSLIVIAHTFNRETCIYNSLFAAAFIILLWNPFMIYSAGFQLSFLAVLGVVYLTRKIERRLSFNNIALVWMWRIIAVTIAAQTAVLPLSIHYFHQAPVYFLAANLVIIPAAGVILKLGVVLLAFGQWEWAGAIAGKALEIAVWIMNEWAIMIDQTPGSKLFLLEISGYQTFLVYTFLFFLFAFLSARQFRLFALMCISVLVFMSIEAVKVVERKRQTMAVFYSVPGHAAIDFVEGHKSYLHASPAVVSKTETLNSRVLPFHVARGLPLKHLNTLDLQSYTAAGRFDAFVFEGKKFVYIRKRPQAQLPGKTIEVDFLAIGGNAIDDLDKVSAFKPEMIVLDMTNHTAMAVKLLKQAEEMNLNCVALSFSGARVFEL